MSEWVNVLSAVPQETRHDFLRINYYSFIRAFFGDFKNSE